MKVAVAVEGEATTRAAQSLSAHPGIEVALLGPTTSSQFPVLDTPEGCAALVGEDRAARAAAQFHLPAVVTGALAGQPGIAWASIQGLGLALAAGFADPARVAVAVVGDPAGEETVIFPSPIDGRAATHETVEDRSLFVARGEGPLAAALALGASRHRVIVDDHRFLEAVALAAGVGALQEGVPALPVPVWERSASYLRAAVDMGLVIGERVPT